MPMCSHSHMFLHAWFLTCLLASMIVCSHVHIFGCSHAWILTCLNAHMFTCFDDHMLPYALALTIACSHAFTLWDHLLQSLHALIIPCSHAHILWWSHFALLTCIDIHLFDIYTHVHILGWWYVYMLEGSSDYAIRRSCTQLLWRL